MSDLKLCRICLRTEVKVYKYDKYQLKYYYEEVMASKVYDNDDLPQYFCYECAASLHNFHKFKENCYSGQKALKEMLWNGPITYELIYNLDRMKHNLKSNLEITHMHHSYFPTINEIQEDELYISDDSILSYLDGKTSPENANLVQCWTANEQEDTSSPTIKLKTVCQEQNSNGCNKKLGLQEKFWKKFILSEEDAIKEFKARAADKKYVDAAFKCTDCYRWFSKKDMLKRHTVRKHSKSLGDHECCLCHMRFRLPCFLRRHMREHYCRYQCLRCDRVCSLENSAMLHDQFHNGVIKKCQHCNEEFLLSSTYYTHLRTHRSEHVCAQCGASFVSPAGLRMHKRLKHLVDDIESPDDDEEVNTYCDKCDIRFDTRKAYEEHLFHSALHAQKENDVISSETSEDTSASRKILGKRERARVTKGLAKKKSADGVKASRGPKRKRPMKTKPTTCHQCGEHFATQAACLKHHVTEHPRTCFFPPAARHICEICGASLAPGSLAVHQNMHSREKIHTCEICGKQFYASIGLKRHLVTHTGEKPFACTLCDKRFTQSNSMKLHYKTFHLKQPYPKRNRRKKCDPQTECPEDPTSEDSDSAPDARRVHNGVEPAPLDTQPEETKHYLTLSEC